LRETRRYICKVVHERKQNSGEEGNRGENNVGEARRDEKCRENDNTDGEEELAKERSKGIG